jgi:hypothetical protein
VWATYSPVKNSPADAQAKAAEGNPTHSATTAEMDFYKCGAEMLAELAGGLFWRLEALWLEAVVPGPALRILFVDCADVHSLSHGLALSSSPRPLSPSAPNPHFSLPTPHSPGAEVGSPQPAVYNGIPVEEYPRVVLAPSFAPTLADVKVRLDAGGWAATSWRGAAARRVALVQSPSSPPAPAPPPVPDK